MPHEIRDEVVKGIKFMEVRVSGERTRNIGGFASDKTGFEVAADVPEEANSGEVRVIRKMLKVIVDAALAEDGEALAQLLIDGRDQTLNAMAKYDPSLLPKNYTPEETE